MMIICSLIIHFMPKMVAVLLRRVWRGVGRWSLGALLWPLLKHHSPGICSAVQTVFFFFFCLASLVSASLGKKLFPFPWPWRGCGSDHFVVFFKVNCTIGFGLRSERMTNRKATPSQHLTSEQASQQEKGHQIHLLHLLWRGDQHQKFTRFPSAFVQSAAWTLWFFRVFFTLRHKKRP